MCFVDTPDQQELKAAAPPAPPAADAPSAPVFNEERKKGSSTRDGVTSKKSGRNALKVALQVGGGNSGSGVQVPRA